MGRDCPLCFRGHRITVRFVHQLSYRRHQRNGGKRASMPSPLRPPMQQAEYIFRGEFFLTVGQWLDRNGWSANFHVFSRGNLGFVSTNAASILDGDSSTVFTSTRPQTTNDVFQIICDGDIWIKENCLYRGRYRRVSRGVQDPVLTRGEVVGFVRRDQLRRHHGNFVFSTGENHRYYPSAAG